LDKTFMQKLPPKFWKTFAPQMNASMWPYACTAVKYGVSGGAAARGGSGSSSKSAGSHSCV
jgi:hypothetical protein